MRGSGRTSTAAKRASSACSAPTVRAEKPHAGASGVPFMKRITSFCAIASAIASRIGLVVLIAHGVPHWLRVVNDRAWIGPPISSPKIS